MAAEWLEMELIELLSGCTWVKGEWRGGGVMLGRGQGRCLNRRSSSGQWGGTGWRGMDAGDTGDMRPSMVGTVRGWGGTEPCQRG